MDLTKLSPVNCVMIDHVLRPEGVSRKREDDKGRDGGRRRKFGRGINLVEVKNGRHSVFVIKPEEAKITSGVSTHEE